MIGGSAMIRVLAIIFAVAMLSGCAFVKDFVRHKNCGPDASSHAGCGSNSAVIEDPADETPTTGSINPYTGDLSKAYLD